MITKSMFLFHNTSLSLTPTKLTVSQMDIYIQSCFVFSLLVLFAMKEDSEKVPTLLTDYILKGNTDMKVFTSSVNSLY